MRGAKHESLQITPLAKCPRLDGVEVGTQAGHLSSLKVGPDKLQAVSHGQDYREEQTRQQTPRPPGQPCSSSPLFSGPQGLAVHAP